jgi:hypothetical protein
MEKKGLPGGKAPLDISPFIYPVRESPQLLFEGLMSCMTGGGIMPLSEIEKRPLF